MTLERMHPPWYWQMRAEEFRAKADNCDTSPSRNRFPGLAQTYDDLAKRAEQIRTVQDAVE
jgi:hypothetical protein